MRLIQAVRGVADPADVRWAYTATGGNGISQMRSWSNAGEWKYDVDVDGRRVFWECQAADIFQANCFSRP